LPQIQIELETALQQTRASIQLLPKPPSDDAILEVTTLVHSFIRELDQMIEGVPRADGLIQTIRPAQEEFRRNIRRTAPDFRPFESGQKRGKTQPMFPDPDFLLDEEGHEHWFPPSNNEQPSITARVPIYVDQVLTRAEKYFFCPSCFEFFFLISFQVLALENSQVIIRSPSRKLISQNLPVVGLILLRRCAHLCTKHFQNK
jgi:hypothetical protein